MPRARRPSADTIGFFVVAAALVWLFVGSFLAHAPLGSFDWPKERLFYSTLRVHLRAHGTPPIAFLDVPAQMLPPVRYMPTLMQSSSYLGNPEVLTFSPLLPLLALLPVDLFLRIYFALHLLVGAFGIWLLARRLALAPWAALVLFALTILNPWLVQHLVVGYTPHITFTLCPLVIALLVGERFAVADWIAASLVQALILYEGGLHVFNWFNGALLVFALAARGRQLLTRAAAALAGGLLLAAPKLAVVAQSLGRWRRDPLDGIHRLHDLWGLLTDGHTDPFRIPQAYGVYSTNLYDGALYVGAPFVLLIVAALILAAWRRDRRAVGLAAVTVVFSIFAWRSVWPSLAKVIRVADMELYPYRFLFVALMAMTALVVWQIAALVARGGHWRWLILLFVPTLVATNLRTRDYVRLTQQPVPADCRPEVLEAAIAAPKPALAEDRRELPTTRTGSTIVIDAGDAHEVALPWLHAARADDFTAEGARIARADLQGGLVLVPTAKQIRLAPKSHHFWLIALVAWSLFVALATGFRIVSARRTRDSRDRA